MATIKSTTIEQAADGRRIAKVIFTPHVPNPAAQSDIEVVFEVRKTEAVHLGSEPYGLVGPISCTTVDTREPYTLSRPQREAVMDAALIGCAEEDDSSWD